MEQENLIIARKTPRQSRSRATVVAIIEAAAHILLADGYDGFNTNRVAEVAGVSIGSLYQYFPNKDALILALWEEHAQDLQTHTLGRLKEVMHLPLRDIFYEMVRGSIQAHQINPDLHRVLSNDVPKAALEHLEQQSKDTSLTAFKGFLISRKDECRSGINFDMAVTLIHKLVENMTHTAVIDEPELLDEDDLIDEIVRMIMAYLE